MKIIEAIIWQKIGDERRYSHHAIELDGIEGAIAETMCGMLHVVRRKVLQTATPAKRCKRCDAVIRTARRDMYKAMMKEKDDKKGYPIPY